MKIILSIACLLLTLSSMAQTIIIRAVGDVLLHKKLQVKGQKQGFKSLWSKAIPLIKKADIAYANLEGPAASNITRFGRVATNGQSRHIYTSFPMFNYPPSLIDDLKSSGFDIVSTANNHSLDRFAIGIDKTIDKLNEASLLFVGTRKKGSLKDWYQITDTKGIRLAWISCTQDTNGIKDKYKQVLYCYKKDDRKLIKNLITELKHQVDGIILTPHWGVQYRQRPHPSQKHFAKDMLNAGAFIILGSHPHVVQPMKSYTTDDGRETFIAYSLGNFVSNQGSLANRTSGVLSLHISKKAQKLTVDKIEYFPTFMQNRAGRLFLDTVKSKRAGSYRLLKRVLSEQFISLKQPN